MSAISLHASGVKNCSTGNNAWPLVILNQTPVDKPPQTTETEQLRVNLSPKSVVVMSHDGADKVPESTNGKKNLLGRNKTFAQTFADKPLISRFSKTFAFYCVTKPQLALFIALHSLTTLAIFLHFFAKKWRALDAAIPSGAPHYWQKHIVPPIEFGAMHTLLYQMVFLPLTMCRHFLTFVRSTRLNVYLPVNDLKDVHVFLGLSMFIQLILAFALFLFHFGSLCAWHRAGTDPVNGCGMFTIEIMITGYVILALVLIIGITSMLRFRIKFEAFKYTHYLFIPLYAVTILHTLDAKGRSGMHERSQAWFWLLVPILFYIADVLYGILSLKTTQVMGGTIIQNPRGLVLRIRRPQDFEFSAGQFLRLNVPSISLHEWHAYSIASAPRDRRWIELYVTVMEGGWTERLHDKLTQNFRDEGELIKAGLTVRLDGPYGSTFQDATQQRNLMAVSAGSGVAPLISLLRHVALGSKMIGQGQEFRNVKPVKTLRSSDSNLSYDTDLGDSVFERVGIDLDHHTKIAAYYASMQKDFSYSAATQTPFIFAIFTFSSCVDIFLSAMGWSLFSNNVQQRGYYEALDTFTATLIAVFLANMVFWLHKQRLAKSLARLPTSTITDQLVLSVFALVIMITVNYMTRVISLDSNLRVPLLVVSSLLAVYRLMWNLAHTPLFHFKPETSDVRAVSFLQRVSFLWLCAPDVFEWLGPELISLAELLKETCGPDYFHPYIFIRSATMEQQIELTNMVAGTAMEGSLRFFASTSTMIVDEICTDVLDGTDMKGSIGIYYCGNRPLARQLRQSIISAREDYTMKEHPIIYGAEEIY